MKHISFFLLSAVMIAAVLTSCDNETGSTVGENETSASASGGGYAALKPNDEFTAVDIPSPYDGKVVFTTDTHVISEADGKYILYTVSGEKVRTLTDFGEVRYFDNGVIKSHCVLFSSSSVYTLDNDGLNRVDGVFQNAYILGDYIISGGWLYTGNFERIGTFMHVETEPYSGFSDGAVITGISRYADSPEIPYGGEISSKTSIFYLEAIDTLPKDLRQLCVLDMGALYESDGILYLMRDNIVYRFPVTFDGEIITALDGVGGILINDNGIPYILTLFDITPDVNASALFVKASLNRVILDGAFGGMTVLRNFVLDSDGEPLIAENNGTFDLWGNVLAEFRYTYSEGESTDLDFVLYDTELHILDGAPYSHMYRSTERIIAYSTARRHVMIFSTDGKLLYESGEMRAPILFEEFGAAVLTLEDKVQFISFDGIESEALDGWREGLVQAGVSSLMYPTYIEQYGAHYYPVCFIDGNTDETLYFWFDPETGHSYTETTHNN